MKEIIHNDLNIKDEEVTRIIKRAKLLVENNNNQIIIAFSHGTYQLIGGHVEDNEEDFECIKRELLEEAGMDVSNIIPKEICRIIYYTRKDNEVKKYIANYYSAKTDIKPNIYNVNLTEDEINGKFEIRIVDKEIMIDELNKNLLTSPFYNVTKDTLDVVETYLENEN